MKHDRFFASFKITVLLLALLAGQTAWATEKTVTYKISGVATLQNGDKTVTFVRTAGSDTPFDGGQDSYETTISANSMSDLATSPAGDYTVNFSDGFSLRLEWSKGSGAEITNSNIKHGSNLSTITFTVVCKSPQYFVKHVLMASSSGTLMTDINTRESIDNDYEYAYRLQQGFTSRDAFGQITITYDNETPLSLLSSPSAKTYNITSERDLAVLAAHVNGGGCSCKDTTFHQTKDITFNSGEENNYSPIGCFQQAFLGTYDGQGYTISGITVNQSNRDIGLFGSVYRGTIMNVVLSHSSFSGNFCVGSIVGEPQSTTIINCRVLDITINASQTDSYYLGAIVGSCDKANLLQNNYYHGCTVCGRTTQVGIGGRSYSSDCDGARSIHTVTPYNVSVSGGETVVVDNQTYYAADAPITVSYTGSISDGQVPLFTYNDGTDHTFSASTLIMPAADISIRAELISAQSKLTAQPADGRYWATFYDGLWRYQLPLGTTAYTMGYDHHLYRLGDDGRTIPAGTAVVIISDRTDIPLTRTNDASPVDIHGSTNALLGSDNPVTLTGGKLGDKDVYVMGVVNDHLGFYTYNGSAIPAGKAYYKEAQVVDLASLTSSYTAQDGDILTGTVNNKLYLQIADNATVTLYDAIIAFKPNGPGISCLGNATIILVGTNTVEAGSEGYAGILCGGSGTTLTIRGTGSLTVRGRGKSSTGNDLGKGGAGIGGDALSYQCGDIRIEGGTITAYGGYYAAGIGCGFRDSRSSSCGSIYISGGTITAYGGDYAAGIGCGYSCQIGPHISNSTCGNVTITRSVTSITALIGDHAPYSIGKGYNDEGTQQCGTITIGGVNYGTDGIDTSPFIYAP